MVDTYQYLSSSGELQQDRYSIRARHQVIIGKCDGTATTGHDHSFFRAYVEKLIIHHFHLIINNAVYRQKPGYKISLKWPVDLKDILKLKLLAL